MTSKEALENLTYCVNGIGSKEKYYNIIKQDLERLEKIEENYYSLNISCEEIEFENVRLEEENKKLKQAIDILKDKKVSIGLLLKNNTLNQYNRVRHLYDADFLIQEEYELLKEVFENE